jgi:hypothetical protein
MGICGMAVDGENPKFFDEQQRQSWVEFHVIEHLYPYSTTETSLLPCGTALLYSNITNTLQHTF